MAPKAISDWSQVLVTGGAGFIGSHLCEFLLHTNSEVQITIIDDFSTGREGNVNRLRSLDADRIHVRRGRVGQVMRDMEAATGFDAIFHLAAAVGVRLILDAPIETIETNVLETAEVLRFADEQGIPTLVASSSEVYGKSTSTPFREDQDVVLGSTRYTRWLYACTKMIDEYLALAHARERKLPVVITRFFNTVGPGQVGDYGMVLPRFVTAALRNEPLEVYGDGRQRRCFCDVRDVVEVLPLLLTNPSCHGKVFNVGRDELIQIKDLAQLVIDTLGSESEIRFVPYEDAYATGFEDLAVRRPDLTQLKKQVEFAPKRSLKDTIRDVADAIAEGA